MMKTATLKINLMVIFVLAMLFGATVQAQPQYYYDPGSGYINNNIPFNNANLNRRQTMYFPSDFNSPVAGVITKVYFKASAAVNPNYQSLQIYLGTSSAGGLVSGPYVTAGMVQVLNAVPFTATSTTNNWIEFTLTTPFLWDLTQNLIVDVQHGGITQGFFGQFISVSGRTSIYGDASSTSPSSQTTRLAVFGFDMVPAGTLCTGAPQAGNVASDTSQVCANTTVNLTSSLTATTGLKYQWQSSTDSVNWSDLTNDTTLTAAVSVSTTSWYRLQVACDTLISESIPVKVEVKDAPMPVATSNVVIVNAGGADVQFDGSASTDFTTLTWDFGDGSSTVMGVSPMHTYTSNGNYTVTITAVGPCGTTTDTINVEITTIGLQELFMLSALEIFPNPSAGQFNVKLKTKEATSLELRVVNVQGQILLNQNYGIVHGEFFEKVDLDHVAQGVYLLQVLTDEGAITRRITLKN